MGVGTSALQAILAQIWIGIVVIGYILSAFALFVIIYSTIRLFDIREREKDFYGTLILSPEASGDNPRWLHIKTLMTGMNPSDWRTAILEADIMLDDMLTRQGYPGDSVGEKLRNIERADFNTVSDAWEAHKVRNQIAHDGSSFDLSENLARRTIARYESVFREFEAI